jgi:hypothetical protein
MLRVWEEAPRVPTGPIVVPARSTPQGWDVSPLSRWSGGSGLAGMGLAGVGLAWPGMVFSSASLGVIGEACR